MSIWDIRRRLGVISTKFHMEYADYCDPRHRRTSGGMSTWQAVLCGCELTARANPIYYYVVFIIRASYASAR